MKSNSKLFAAAILLGLMLSPTLQAQGDAGSSFADILGDNGTIDFDGSLNMVTDPETGELSMIKLTKGIVIRGDLMNLDCDDLVLDNAKQIMTAKGKLVHFDNGDVSGTCGRLVYDIEKKVTTLEVNPVVNKKAEDGSITRLSGGTIILTQEGEATSVTIDKGGRITVSTEKKEAKASSGDKREKAAPKIVKKNVGTIRSPSPAGG